MTFRQAAQALGSHGYHGSRSSFTKRKGYNIFLGIDTSYHGEEIVIGITLSGPYLPSADEDAEGKKIIDEFTETYGPPVCEAVQHSNFDRQCVEDLRPDPVKPHPEQPVDGEEPRPARALPAQDGQLMSQGDEFELQGDATTNPKREQGTKADACSCL